MPAKEPVVPPTDRIQSCYKQLSVAAKDLNKATDELGDAVSVFDVAIQQLNLGVSAWVTISRGNDPEYGDWWNRDIGYAKLGNKWGIALRRQSGNVGDPEHDEEEKWLFNEAPRWMRIESANRVIELLEALLKQAEDTTKSARAKAEEVLSLAAAMSKAVQPEQK